MRRDYDSCYTTLIMLDKNLAVAITQALKSNPNIIACYSIGSYANQTHRPGSDFDLAVVVENKRLTDDNQIYELIRHLKFPADLDLSVVDKQSSPLFLFQVISQGKRIYMKDAFALQSFEAFVLHNYYDTQHIRNIYNSYLGQKFAPQKYANQ